MIYTTCVMFYTVFAHGLSSFKKMLIALLVILIAVFTTLYYHYIKDPLFHQNMFALLTFIVFARSVYVMETTLRPSWRTKAARIGEAEHSEEQTRRDQRDLAILRIMWQMIPLGLGSVALGFLIWNLDNIYCSQLRRWRRDIGLPWGIFLEGHGWW